MKHYIHHSIKKSSVKNLLVLSAIIIGISSCNDFLDAKLDKSLISEDRIFGNKVTATSAVTGMYNSIAYFGALSGSAEGASALTNLSADEITNFPQTKEYVEFENHRILFENPKNAFLWNNTYNLIYQANAILEGIDKSTELSTEVKNQLNGEALFTRAFSYFHLVNLFGEIPLITETSYLNNMAISRTSTDKIWETITNDLLRAQSLLSDKYPTNERVRPNKWTASALLSRVYLYRKDYAKSETVATELIGAGLYELNPDLESVFLKASTETIWQIMAIIPGYTTLEADSYIVTFTPIYNIPTTTLINTFDQNDERRSVWFSSFYDANLDSTIVYPYKYKTKSVLPGQDSPEHSIVFRLAETYLIRAEARANQDNLVGAAEDLNMIRRRAGLDDLVPTDKGNMLLAIEHERQVELFTEGCHRWFDLKRTGRATAVLGISENAQLYPIPKSEFDRNPNLGLQNDGY